MGEDIDYDPLEQKEDKTEVLPPTENLPVKAPVGTVDRIMPIACQNVDETYRVAQMFALAGMVPKSYEVGSGANIDWKATQARMATAIMAGSEVGFGPAASLKNIYIINGLACVFGQGAKALVSRSGTLEWQRVTATGSWDGKDYEVTVSLKRRGQDEPYVRSFGYKDAEKAGLLGRARAGTPWKTYPENQAFWRAWTFAARDGFSDALMGLTISEELQDYAVIEQRREDHKTDASSLDDET